jgi:uncharacterized membrane protein YhhN
MRKQSWLILFGIDGLINLFSITANWHWLTLVSKSLLMPFLIAWFVSNIPDNSRPRLYVMAALFFSWLGDVFLLVDEPKFFMAGLASFLFAHLLYIFFFANVIYTQTEKQKWNPWISGAVYLYAILLFFFLRPHLGALQTPVFVYAATIATMLVCSIQAFKNNGNRQTYFCIAGAALFVLSDSLLATNKFYQPFAGASFGVMLSYIMAQYCIVRGAITYLSGN